ncbi:hypothetical protein [Bradyrhizobium lablabi]|uniref:hypothetical protein n=1 Tax=Bradyrhizobium lablabi TaxID=722472 RepID=UPI001BABFFE9|nr:hypothetical protein [Bradyrhizobium lablabi]MBR0692729.1 hypothetical protein [Bradyrhizobium lablabi]
MKRILLIDLSERELKERVKLHERHDQLVAAKRIGGQTGGLTDAQEADLVRIAAALDSDYPVDPFFQSVAAAVTHTPWTDLIKNRDSVVAMYGLFGSQWQRPNEADEELTEEEKEVAFVCGLLELDNITLASAPDFIKKVSEAHGELRQNEALFRAAYTTFSRRYETDVQRQIDQGLVDRDILGCIDPDGSINQDPDQGNKPYRRDVKGDPHPADMPGWEPFPTDIVNVMSAKNIAAVVRKLVNDRVTANDPWISSRLESAYNMTTGVVEGAPPSTIEIMLPDLEEAIDIEIVKGNVEASQGIYFCWQLDEGVRLFQVVERIVDLFRQGLVPVGRGKVGDFLFGYYKKAAERLTEAERRDLYLRMFGAPGGNPASEPNRDFNELWLRFVSAVSSFARQLTVERLLRNSVPMAVSQEQVRKAARDLGANLSRNGYGIGYYAATELQQTIIEFRDILQDSELRNAFGARDMWQVIDMVNVNYLGGARNTHRYRTQSRAGAVIIRWVADNVQRLANIGGDVIDPDAIVNPRLRIVNASANPLLKPSDWDLVNACEQWLAVGGVQEQSIEQYSQPIEAPTMTSRPIDIPQVARDVLGGMGIGLNGSGSPTNIGLPSL